MNYGPLAQAIDNLLACDRKLQKKKTGLDDHEEHHKFQRAWQEVFTAQDKLAADVKAGTLE